MAIEPLAPPNSKGIDDTVIMSRRLVDHARSELENGNRLHASERVWSAAAYALKAIAIQRGWRHRSRGNILDVGEHLGREFDREGPFLSWLNTADAMHQNFYENHREDNAIRFAIAEVERFLDELDEVRMSLPRPFTVADSDDSKRLGRLLGLEGSQCPPIGARSEVGFSLNHPSPTT